MKKILLSLTAASTLLVASFAHAGPCAAIIKSCLKSGASTTNHTLHQCEWEEAKSTNNTACVAHLKKQYSLHHKKDAPTEDVKISD